MITRIEVPMKTKFTSVGASPYSWKKKIGKKLIVMPAPLLMMNSDSISRYGTCRLCRPSHDLLSASDTSPSPIWMTACSLSAAVFCISGSMKKKRLDNEAAESTAPTIRTNFKSVNSQRFPLMYSITVLSAGPKIKATCIKTYLTVHGRER